MNTKLYHKFSRDFVFATAVLVILAVLFIPARNVYAIYYSQFYKNLGDQSYNSGDYSGATNYYQSSLSFKSDEVVLEKLESSFKLELASRFYFQAIRLLSDAKTKDDFQKIKGLLEKVIESNIFVSQSSAKISQIDQKLSEIAATEKAAADLAAQQAAKQATQAISQKPKSTTKSTASAPNSQSMPFFQCRKDVDNLITWIACDSNQEDILFVQAAQQALGVLQNNDSAHYDYFYQWVTGVRFEYHEVDMINPGVVCLYPSSPIISCSKAYKTVSINRLAAILVHEAAHRDYWVTRPDFTNQDNQQAYAESKEAEVIAVIGE